MLGWDVLLSDLYSPAMKSVTGGAILYKDHAVSSDMYVSSLQKRNVKVFCHDEEGLIVGDTELYRKSRISNYILKECQGVFAWGRHTAELFPREFADKIHVTGSPKFDYARDYLALLEINSGPQVTRRKNILINTRFSFNNGLFEDSDPERLINLGVIKAIDEYPAYLDFYKNELTIFEEFLKLIRLLANRSEVEVLVRPHPSERREVYDSLVCSNIKVDRDQDLREQITWADIVIHDGCTTAMEAKFMGRKVFGLRPICGKNAYDDFANQFSENYTSAELLANHVLSVDDVEDDIVLNTLHNYGWLIENWSLDVDSINSMLDLMGGVKAKARIKRLSWVWIIACVKIEVCKLVGVLKVSQFLPRKLEAMFAQWVMAQDKFPQTAEREIKDKVRKLRNLDPKFDRLPIDIVSLGNNSWLFNQRGG